MKRRADDTIVRAALARGPLVRDGRHWRFQRRLFNGATVNEVIAAGDAVKRDRDTVVAREARP
jgi:hypothetical protein